MPLHRTERKKSSPSQNINKLLDFQKIFVTFAVINYFNVAHQEDTSSNILKSCWDVASNVTDQSILHERIIDQNVTGIQHTEIVVTLHVKSTYKEQQIFNCTEEHKY